MTHSGKPVEIDVAGVSIHAVDFAALLDFIAHWIADPSPQCRQICTVNPEFVVDSQHNAEFAAALARAALRVPDGVGILWAARRRGHKLAERVTGSDGIYRIAEAAARQGWRLFLLGAAHGVAEQTAAALSERYPGLQICGVYAGSPAEAEWPAIRDRLTAAKPNLLFVAFGHPKQDLWIDLHRHELPVQVALGVGGAFDFVAGVTRRAPLWLQRLGLEWLHRLWQEPWRWRRMLKLPIFVWLVLTERQRHSPNPPRTETEE